MKPVKIPDKERDYILQLANMYEKSGFLEEAASLYERLQPTKGRKIYLSIAKKAEKKGFMVIAARMYGYAGREKKSLSLWRKLATEFDKKGFTILSREAYLYSKPEDPKHIKMRKLTQDAWKFVKIGEFKKAQRAFLIAAKFSEKNKWYDNAATFYFHAGDLNGAKRMVSSKKSF